MSLLCFMRILESQEEYFAGPDSRPTSAMLLQNFYSGKMQKFQNWLCVRVWDLKSRNSDQFSKGTLFLL